MRLVRSCLAAVVLTALAAPVAAARPAKKPAPAAKAAKAKPAARPAPRRPAAPADEVARLGRGHRLFEEGDYAAAARELLPLADGKLVNRDLALYLLGQAELLSGKSAEAARHFAALEKLGGRLATLAAWRAADARWEGGDLDGARRAYEALLGKATKDVDPALALARIGEALEKAGKKEAAAKHWRRVHLEHPFHPLADQALERLAALGAPPLTTEERLARAGVLSANRAWQRALDELAALPSDLPQTLRDEVDLLEGMTRFRMRRNYDVAARKLIGVWPRLSGEDRRASALFHGARAWSRADQDDEAIKQYREVVARFPRSRWAAEASFLIGWLDHNRGKHAEAVPALEDTLRRYGSSKFATDARWYIGWARWLSGDTERALGDFERLAREPGALVGGKGSYWAARALHALGKKEQAVAGWRALVTRYPFSYYAALARLRLRAEGVELGPFGDGPNGAPPALDDGAVLDGDPDLARADELLKAGLLVEAGTELARVDRAIIKRYGAARALPGLFDRYQRAEAYRRAYELAQVYGAAALRLDPQKDPLVQRWWSQVYPLAYRPLVEKYAPSGGNPPYYLYTIMQKESGYNPHDVSYADAIGLLQMIPPTSRRVAPHVGLTYTDDILYDPEGNLRLGAWYIGHLLKKFKGQIPIGAGSFNAGPKAMTRWLKRSGERPLDEFVELCSYTQTREYMKKVVEIYGRYVWLHAKEDYLPSLAVDADWLGDDGIDY